MNTQSLAKQVGESLLSLGWTLATAESCTGGSVAAALTDIAGSSQWFERGFVTYSNASKVEMLGVDARTLADGGAVSEMTVREMVGGALARSRAQVALAISGIAGPGGGTADKPVGMVCFAWGVAGAEPVTRTDYFQGDRAAVRARSVTVALQGVLDVIAAAHKSPR